jgi:heme exporter protein C
VIWGAYWDWGDARLTSTLILWLVYLGYLTMRGAVEDRELRGRYSAIIGLMGALLVPFIHLSVYLFDSMHPKPMVLTPEVLGPDRGMDTRMLLTLMLALGAFMLLYIAFLRSRYQLETLREELRERQNPRRAQP